MSAEVGLAGEEAAWALYRRRGYRLVARNWRCGLGELDLVVARGSLLVICEVKARRGAAMGGPHEAVTAAKQRKLRQLGQAFLAGARSGGPDLRFDVASVTVRGDGTTSVHLFEDAF
jgi:putative endonuclease